MKFGENIMKKIILVIITIFSFTSCKAVDYILWSALDAIIFGGVVEIVKILTSSSSNNKYDLLVKKGLDELMTKEEKEDKNFKVIAYKSPFKEEASKPIELDNYNLEKVTSFIKVNQDKIIISYNTTVIQQTIEYMSKNQTDKDVLKNCRFIFLNFADREKIQKLSKKMEFKYSYPSLN